MHVPTIANRVAAGFSVFLVAYLWLSFYLRNMFLIFICAFLITLGVGALVRLIPKKRTRTAPPNYIKRIPVPMDFTRPPLKPRNLIVTGLIIFGTSFIIKYNIYYIIVATIIFGIVPFAMYGNPFTRRNGGGQDDVC